MLCRLVPGLFRGASLFATIVEDFPYRHNRVVADESAPGGLRIVYQLAPEAAVRAGLLRHAIAERLARHRPVFVARADNLNYGHPSGTCRFGDDPASSVLDSAGRVRGTENLYVVDASCFPSSSGTNPSLTIAANALRVAECVAAALTSPTSP